MHNYGDRTRVSKGNVERYCTGCYLSLMSLGNKHHLFTEGILLAACYCATIHTAHAQGAASGRILVQKTRRADNQKVLSAIAANGAAVSRTIPAIDTFVVTVPQPALKGVMRALSNSGLFTVVETDDLARGGGVPNDPGYSSQWHLPAINAAGAWDITTGAASVPIAMIDSGVNPYHSDLASKLIAGWSFLLGNNNTADVQGHGTATAGVAAAAGNNANGVAGVSWLSPIMPLVVLNSSDYAAYSDIANAITYAADHGVRIINVSIGGSTASSTLQNAVNYAWNKGAVVFASAMNNSTSTPYYPAACDKVVAVSATEPSDTLSSFSNYGTWIDLAAPGNNILTTDNGGGYSSWYGTSFSSPIAAGTAALALSKNPGLTASSLVTLLEQNADDIGAPGFDTSFGWGRVNAYRVAIAAAASYSADSIAPSISIVSPIGGSAVSGVVQIQGSATDNVGITRVELWVDGRFDSTCGSVTFSCSWNAGAAAPGSHSLTVKAFDAAGNMGSASESLGIAASTINDTQAPSVQITSPSNNATVTGGVSISAVASDYVGVSQICLYVDGVLVFNGTSSSAAYTWNSKKGGKGAHNISAKAWDAAGNVASTSITVNAR